MDWEGKLTGNPSNFMVKSIQKHGFRFRFSRINQSIDSIYLNYGMLLLDYGAKWANFLVEWLNDEVFVDKYPQENATQADY